MTGISTKGAKKNGIGKEIKPGNVVAKINNITIIKTKEPKDPSNPEFKIILNLETKPIGGEFVGFDKVFGDPTKGHYLGQSGAVKTSNWAIRGNKGISKKTGKAFEITADSIILNFTQKLLSTAGYPNWLEDNDGKFKTWEELFSSIIRSKMLKDVYFSWCIGGSESENAEGFSKYYLWLPERKDAPEPFALEGGLVTKFDTSIHVIKKKVAEANENLNEGLDEEDDKGEFAGGTDESPFDEDPIADVEEMNDETLFDMGED
jgi:hypothetical protein